jgi:hypothetical protein
LGPDEEEGDDVRLLVMIHPGRCGSTVLGGMLNQHPAIRWDREIFTELPRNLIPIDDDGTILWRPYIRPLMKRCKKPTLGIEIKVQQIVKQQIFGKDLEEALTRLAEAFDFQLVLLTRKNHVERWLSGAIARETSRFQNREGEVAPDTTLPLPAEIIDHSYGLKKMEVNAWLDEVERMDEVFVAAVERRGGLILRYEDDILEGPARAYGQVLDFVGLYPEKSEPLYIKADRRPLSARLSNFEELAQILRPEHHARYCCADQTPHGSSE